MSDYCEFLKITTKPEELTEGFFGQIILHVFEILPKLYDEKIFPYWNIKSVKYGCAPDYVVVPGLLDINYKPEGAYWKEMSLADARKRYAQTLGNDWEYMNMLWNTYFRVPQRIVEKADMFGDLSNALGLHYRGTDKNLAKKHTQYVSYSDILLLAEDFLETNPGVNRIFLATDEISLVKEAKNVFGQEKVINTGNVEFWNSTNKVKNFLKGDHAILDCLLLSRCKYLIKCQSALSGMAKVLNPSLKAYRISSSKMFADIPYFPDAYIPRLVSDSAKCQKILDRLFKNDWLDDQKAHQKFGKPFQTMVRDEKEVANIGIYYHIKKILYSFLKKLH